MERLSCGTTPPSGVQVKRHGAPRHLLPGAMILLLTMAGTFSSPAAARPAREAVSRPPERTPAAPRVEITLPALPITGQVPALRIEGAELTSHAPGQISVRGNPVAQLPGGIQLRVFGGTLRVVSGDNRDVIRLLIEPELMPGKDTR